MSSCWSSVLAVVGGAVSDEEAQMRARLLAVTEATATEAGAVENLEEDVKALERALAAAEADREAAEARRREAEERTGKAVAELRAAEEEHEGRVEELLLTAKQSDDTDVRIRHLEVQIKIITGITETPSGARSSSFITIR
ncbi:hypothetical protein ZWY2020_004398 [Hordeum vulgare]|nr:hypothetical protein ZWY2020_004398 [Hordeum vulgare]